MKRTLARTEIAALVLLITSVAVAKEKKLKPGPLTGTWQCTSHGGPRGDMNFTLDLQQTRETVAGSVTSPLGSTELSGSYKKKTVEILIDAAQANYVLNAKLNKDQLNGEWSYKNAENGNTAHGTWEGRRQTQGK
jgi:hypothetical protein